MADDVFFINILKHQRVEEPEMKQQYKKQCKMAHGCKPSLLEQLEQDILRHILLFLKLTTKLFLKFMDTSRTLRTFVIQDAMDLFCLELSSEPWCIGLYERFHQKCTITKTCTTSIVVDGKTENSIVTTVKNTTKLHPILNPTELRANQFLCPTKSLVLMSNLQHLQLNDFLTDDLSALTKLKYLHLDIAGFNKPLCLPQCLKTLVLDFQAMKYFGLYPDNYTIICPGELQKCTLLCNSENCGEVIPIELNAQLKILSLCAPGGAIPKPLNTPEISNWLSHWFS